MKTEIIEELTELNGRTEFILNNQDEIKAKDMEDYLKNLEKTRYYIFDKIRLKEKADKENFELNYINKMYKATVEDDILKIYIPEVIPKFKNINNYAYKNIMLNVREHTEQYKNLFKDKLVFVLIKIVENQRNIDIDNKFVKPIIDGLVLSKVIEDDNIYNMFYSVLGITEKGKSPYTEVYVFEGEKILKWIQKQFKIDVLKCPHKSIFNQI